MAAQARSLGFSLVFAAQDLPAMEKRVKEEARSIVANCNIKIFGKLEDPTATRELFEKTITSSFVTEVKSFNTQLDSMTRNYYDSASAGVETRAHVSYEELRGFKNGEAVICSGDKSVIANMYYSNPGEAKAMRVTRFMPLPPPSETVLRHVADITKLRDKMVKKGWSAARANVAPETPPEIEAAVRTFGEGLAYATNPVDAAIMAVAGAYATVNPVDTSASNAAITAAVSELTAVATVTDTSPAPLPPAAPAPGPLSGFTAPKADSPVTATERPSTPGVTTETIQKYTPPSTELPKDINDILREAAQEARDTLVKQDA